MTTPKPAKQISIRFCPKCGRDDMFSKFGKTYHSTFGKRCDGQPVTAVYTFSRVES